MDLTGKNIVVLDLETLHLSSDCLHCGRDEETHGSGKWVCRSFEAIGWNNHKALGISIGCYYSYENGTFCFFDQHTVKETVDFFVETAPLLVSFNGIHFDFPLMNAVAERPSDLFARLYVGSYDILAEILKVSPKSKYVKGINSLNDLAISNGLPQKEMTGTLAPVLWAEGRVAEVVNYNLGDVIRTQMLFEMVCRGTPLIRRDGSMLTLPVPAL